MARRVCAGGLLALFLLGCAAGPQNPWHIPKGREGRFREARKVCHDLTDKDGRIVDRERFDACMYRRGWRRERWTDRIGFSS
ncbi:MAG: hypothetical protein CL910_10280 [Deltaproteobacteria bacterium]|jgi:hypothetical protein|nr:hypothetical protein [Deltaproteobacteria bacterium]